MRRSHHANGSTAAQSTLQALAGWAPSRRGLLGSLLVASAATTATATAAAIFSPAAAADDAAVSPRMAHLISEFIRLDAALFEIDHGDDLDAMDRAADARAPALNALVLERPSNLIDFAAKMSALGSFMADEDGDLYVFRRLAEDATLLAGAAK
jgi:hypothetical protein